MRHSEVMVICLLRPTSARALSDWLSRAEIALLAVENKSQIGPPATNPSMVYSGYTGNVV